MDATLNNSEIFLRYTFNVCDCGIYRFIDQQNWLGPLFLYHIIDWQRLLGSLFLQKLCPESSLDDLKWLFLPNDVWIRSAALER